MDSKDGSSLQSPQPNAHGAKYRTNVSESTQNYANPKPDTLPKSMNMAANVQFANLP
jgi:hypothetical protein